MQNLAIFASGTGTNARRIIEHFQDHEEVRIGLIVSNKATAPVLEMAAAKGVATHVIHRKDFYEDEALLVKFRAEGIGFIVLAGFMWLIPEYLIHAFPDKIINIHPALLPKYGGKGMYGMHVHRAVHEADEAETGITIHYVNPRYDEGQIIFQASCPLSSDDTPEAIAQKVQRLEHRYFPLVIEQLLTR